MSFFSNHVSGFDGIAVAYSPERDGEVRRVPASVVIELAGTNAWLYLSIEDARSLLAQLPGVLAEHDTAVASDKAA
ncbi:hypothetical protein [Nocardia farcinica]|uniref:hypothetical protein n=1 Tax=Nocardia farcinica TaxID=37329 RepID=UPI0024554AEC|nr:hypothetical protein [Nocardia farcinica]